MKEIGGKFLIDTNVLIYLTLARDSRFPQAQSVLAHAADRPGRAFVSVQNLAEMYPNLTGPKMQPTDTPEKARAKIQSIARLPFLTVLPLSWSVAAKALELCADHSVTRQGYFDMQLAAVMLLNSIPTIVTENTKDFAFIKGITATSPFV